MFWPVLCITVMLICHHTWSRYGEYTVWSFVCSVLMHGGFCLAGWVAVNEFIKSIKSNRHEEE